MIRTLAAMTLVIASSPPAQAAEPAPPHLTDGFGLTATSQPRRVDDHYRTFVFSVSTDEVPRRPSSKARETALVTAANLREANIGFHFSDYGDGGGWALGCTGKHAEEACVQADMNHFVQLVKQHA